LSGRYEKELNLERKIKNRLQNAPQIVGEYYYSLVGSGKSYETAYRYINYVLSFLQITFKEQYTEDFYLHVRPIHINKYITYLRTKEINGKIERTSDSIRSVHWSALNSFFQFLVPDYIDNNPVINTKRPKMKDNPHVTYLTPEEISKLIKNVEENAQDKFKNRDLCLLKLGFSTGLRVSAIVQIDINDIDFKNNKIKVTEKGDYDNYVMFGENLKEQIKLCVQDRKKYFADCNSNALFISRLGHRLSDDMVASLLKKYAHGVTDKHVTPHVMRHSCATNLYEKTGDIYLCAKQLNHKNVSTTQRYAELSQERQKKAADILDDMI
jgi:integrase/recombinase XerC